MRTQSAINDGIQPFQQSQQILTSPSFFNFSRRFAFLAVKIRKRKPACFYKGNRKCAVGMRKTKIICTLGPATADKKILIQLIEQGADVFRFNMSHADSDWVRQLVPRIRKLADEARRAIGILLD